MTTQARIAVFASGGGTNLQSLLDHFNGRESPVARVDLVISNRAGAGALARAERAGVPWRVIDPGATEPVEVERVTLEALDECRIDLVALAGYLRLVPGAVVERYAGRILNIHPALLPSFGGAGMYGERVHRAVLESGARVSGATVHYVDHRYDEGRIVAQWPVPVMPDDVPHSLAARVLAVEHMLYPAAIESLLGAGPAPVAPPFEAFDLAAGTPPASSLRALNRAPGGLGET